MDFLVVPTAWFELLYVWFLIEHDPRRIVHFNVTKRTSSEFSSSSLFLRDLFIWPIMDNMDKMSDPKSTPFETITATEAKSSFGAVLDRALSDGGVAISKHAEVKAVLLSVAQYEALVAARPDPLSTLTEEFDGLVERMANPSGRKAGRSLFNASPTRLGRVAAKHRGG